MVRDGLCGEESGERFGLGGEERRGKSEKKDAGAKEGAAKETKETKESKDSGDKKAAKKK